jgi:LysM repeat protein
MLASLALIYVLVSPGNTMSGIAASHQVSLASVEAANPQVTNPNMIIVGQKIAVPTNGGPSAEVHSAPANDGDHDADDDGGYSSPSNVPAPTNDQAPAPTNDQAPAPTNDQPANSTQGGNSAPSAGGGIPAWATCIVQRESGGNPTIVNQIDPGNGGGLFGDLTSTWGNYDGYHQPFQAPVSVQIQFNDQLSGNGSNLLPWAADHCPGT